MRCICGSGEPLQCAAFPQSRAASGAYCCWPTACCTGLQATSDDFPVAGIVADSGLRSQAAPYALPCLSASGRSQVQPSSWAAACCIHQQAAQRLLACCRSTGTRGWSGSTNAWWTPSSAVMLWWMSWQASGPLQSQLLRRGARCAHTALAAVEAPLLSHFLGCPEGVPSCCAHQTLVWLCLRRWSPLLLNCQPQLFQPGLPACCCSHSLPAQGASTRQLSARSYDPAGVCE